MMEAVRHMETRSAESVQSWLLKNGFNLVFALLIAVIGWITNSTLQEIRDEIKSLDSASRTMALTQQGHTSRIEFLEKLVAVQAEKQKAYDEANLEFWKEYGPALDRIRRR